MQYGLVEVAWQTIHEMSFEILGEETDLEAAKFSQQHIYIECGNYVQQINLLIKYFLLYLFTCNFIHAKQIERQRRRRQVLIW
jgi:hypothetical protein